MCWLVWEMIRLLGKSLTCHWCIAWLKERTNKDVTDLLSTEWQPFYIDGNPTEYIEVGRKS